MNALKNFEVSLMNVENRQIIVKRKALEPLAITDIVTQIDNLKFEQDEIKNIGNTLQKIADKLMEDSDVREYFQEKVLDEFISDEEISRRERIRVGIDTLCQMLHENIYITASSKDDKERRKEYDKFLKCLVLLGKVFEDTKKEPIFVAGSLSMLTDASEVCASGWKDNITNCLINFKDDIERKFLKLTYQQDGMKKILEEVFFEARESVARDLGYDYINKNEIHESERPHYIDIFRTTLNNIYELNLPQIEMEDSYIEERYRNIRDDFIRSISNVAVYDCIYDKACEYFYDRVIRGGEVYGVLADWAKDYIRKNNIALYKDNVQEFLSTYVMTGEYDEKIKYVAIKQIMKDCGFIEEMPGKMAKEQIDIRRRMILADVKTKEDMININQELIELYRKNIDISFAFEVETKVNGESIITNDTLKQIVELDPNRASNTLMGICETGYITKLGFLLDNVPTLEINIQNSVDETLLMIAIRNNANFEVVQEFLKRGANVNKANILGATALMYACRYSDDEKIVKALLDAKAEINSVNFEDFTPLILALRYNDNPNIAKMLIERGAQVNFQSGEGWTPLMIASKYNKSLELIKLILEKDTDVNRVKTGSGVTALMLASRHSQSVDVVKALIEKGANVNMVDRDGDTALMYSVSEDNSDVGIVKTLLDEGADPNIKNRYGFTPLVTAEIRGKGEMIKALIKGGSDVNIVIEYGFTPLTLAIINNCECEIVKMLIESGTNLEIKNRNGETALMLAVTNDIIDLDIIQTLLENGANPNEKDVNGYSVLMNAILKHENEEIIKTLIRNGADVNIQGKDGWTPLMLAVRYNQNDEIVKILMNAGADVSKRNEAGYTALTIAKNCRPEIVDVLKVDNVLKRAKSEIIPRDNHDKGREM